MPSEGPCKRSARRANQLSGLRETERHTQCVRTDGVLQTDFSASVTLQRIRLGLWPGHSNLGDLVSTSSLLLFGGLGANSEPSALKQGQ